MVTSSMPLSKSPPWAEVTKEIVPVVPVETKLAVETGAHVPPGVVVRMLIPLNSTVIGRTP